MTEQHVARIYMRAKGNPAQFVMAVAKYCAEAEHGGAAAGDPQDPGTALVYAFDFDHQMNNGGVLEFFTRGLGGRNTVAALEAIGAEAVRDMLARAYELTPDAYIEAMRHAESLGDDSEAEYDPGIDEDELFAWEESLDEIDDAYYDMARDVVASPPIENMPPPQPMPVHPVIAALYAHICANMAELDAVIEPVYQRLKAEGKIG